MISEETTLSSGMLVRHEDGPLHRVEDVRPTTSYYQEAWEIGRMTVNHTQLQDTDFPAGSQWSTNKEDFYAAFDIVWPPQTPPEADTPPPDEATIAGAQQLFVETVLNRIASSEPLTDSDLRLIQLFADTFHIPLNISP